MKTPTYTLYYKEDTRLTYLPKDREMTALKYVAVRYITKGEIPVLLSNPQGVCFNESLTEDKMQELAAWYYSLYPEHRRESRRVHLLEELQLNINLQTA